MISSQTFAVNDFDSVKIKVLNWLQRFNTFCFLDNHQYQLEPHTQECLAGAGVRREVEIGNGNCLSAFQALLDKHRAWYFGHLSYDLKNELYPLESSHPDHVGFPSLYFFEPLVVIRLQQREMIIEADDPLLVYNEIEDGAPVIEGALPKVNLHNRVKKKEYLSIIEKLRQHILRGDCYEINFCQEFFAENILIEPIQVYTELAKVSPNPFSALYRLKDRWVFCASPERFLCKKGSTLLSQPIKGTSKRNADQQLDEASRNALYHSEKDRSENVMIVDLVRNDLSMVCKEGSVKVDELFGIYSFPQVHQMISTISGEIEAGTSFEEIIRATFPMGSMTGAPKLRVMQLIEQYEKTGRGLFSGAIGYITPTGDFDFNVIIRSLFYHAANQYLSLSVGSGITFNSDPESEWQECIMKIDAIGKMFQ